jgi:diadenosine tetraphosphatase ApaH/serine/threonine PP2A family protein phosphatase
VLTYDRALLGLEGVGHAFDLALWQTAADRLVAPGRRGAGDLGDDGLGGGAL